MASRALRVLIPDGWFANRWTFIIDERGKIRAIGRTVGVGARGRDLGAKFEALNVPKVRSNGK